MKEIRLKALLDEGKPILYDMHIWDSEKEEWAWAGSRRTFNGCACFLGLKPEHLIRLAELK